VGSASISTKRRAAWAAGLRGITVVGETALMIDASLLNGRQAVAVVPEWMPATK
jgi:hypothetical protein